MSDDMQQDAVGYAMQAMEKYNIEKDIAASVKKACQIRSQTCFISDNWWWLHDFVYWFCFLFFFAGVWQKVQSHMALHRWEELWQLCDTWDKALHLFLPGPSSHSAVQVRLKCKHSFILDTTFNSAILFFASTFVKTHTTYCHLFSHTWIGDLHTFVDQNLWILCFSLIYFVCFSM